MRTFGASGGCERTPCTPPGYGPVCPIKIDKMFEIHVQFGKYTCICHSTKCMEQNVLYALLACNNCKFIYKESIIILTHKPEEIMIQNT